MINQAQICKRWRQNGGRHRHGCKFPVTYADESYLIPHAIWVAQPRYGLEFTSMNFAINNSRKDFHRHCPEIYTNLNAQMQKGISNYDYTAEQPQQQQRIKVVMKQALLSQQIFQKSSPIQTGLGR